MQMGQSFDVGFINNGMPPWNTWWRIIFPIVFIIRHNAVRQNGGRIPIIRLSQPAMKAGIVLHTARYQTGARVEQQLRRVKAVPLFRLPRSVYPITIASPRRYTGEITVPDIAGTCRQAMTHFIAIFIKQTKFYPFCVRRKQREIYPMPIKRSAQRGSFTSQVLRHSPSRTSQSVDNGGKVRLND